MHADHRPDPLPPPLPTAQRLLDVASGLIRTIGHVPPISEVARLAGVSRATAYRHFSSRSKLIAAVVDHSLGPVRRFESSLTDAPARVDELFLTTFPRFHEYEPQMRAALQLSLEHEALASAGRLDEEAYRRGYRVAILRRALEPLQGHLPASEIDRLSKALSLLFGIEPYVVLKDMWACSNEEVGDIAHWMARTLVESVLRANGSPAVRPHGAEPAPATSPPHRATRRRPAR